MNTLEQLVKERGQHNLRINQKIELQLALVLEPSVLHSSPVSTADYEAMKLRNSQLLAER